MGFKKCFLSNKRYGTWCKSESLQAHLSKSPFFRIGGLFLFRPGGRLWDGRNDKYGHALTGNVRAA